MSTLALAACWIFLLVLAYGVHERVTPKFHRIAFLGLLLLGLVALLVRIWPAP